MDAVRLNNSTLALNPCELETTRASPLHRWTHFDGQVWPRGVLIYVITVLLTYGLLFAAALVSGVLTASPSSHLRLPFLEDWNIAFTFLGTVPVIVIFLVSDQCVLQSALRRVQETGALVIPALEAKKFARVWSRRIGRANAYTQIVTLIVSVILSAVTLRLYFVTRAGFWAAPSGPLRLVGVVYWYCITILYFVIAYYCYRCIQQAYLLRDLVHRSTISVRPFHPDGCGGLHPIGALGLRNQYTLTVLGLNIVIVAAINYTSLATAAAERQILAIQ
jgi:hypothetical protein